MANRLLDQTLALATSEATSTGDVAARCFDCFDCGMLPDEVVTNLVLPADTVDCSWRTWARLRGLVPLSFEIARALREALYWSRPLMNGADVVTAIQRFADRPLKLCTRCNGACPEYCTDCPTREALRAARKSRKH